MNTWGIYSINATSFNTHINRSVGYPKEIRDKVYTALKVNNLIFNAAGYISGVRAISGCVRIAIALVVLVRTIAIGDPKADRGTIVGPFYYEALWTAVAQCARGALEALPHGLLVNLTLDVVASPWNLYNSAHWADEHSEWLGYPITSWRPMAEPTYPLVFEPLHVV